MPSKLSKPPRKRNNNHDNRNLERYGDATAASRESINSERGWSAIMNAFAKAPNPIKNSRMNLNEALLAAYATSNRINIFLTGHIPDAAWHAKQPGGKGRDIASMAAHMHNVRLLWLKSAGKTTILPAKLEGESCIKAQVIEAFNESFTAMREVLASALATDGRIKGFKPDAASFFAYLIAHDAHHRGQMTMLARQLGHPVSQSAMFGLWEWGTR